MWVVGNQEGLEGIRKRLEGSYGVLGGDGVSGGLSKGWEGVGGV